MRHSHSDSPSRCSLSDKRIGSADLLEFVTSSEYIMSTETAVRYASECCDEYNTYTTLSEEFRVVFRFLSQTIYL